MLIDMEISGKIINCAMKVHGFLGPGFLESVYKNALMIELNKNNIIAEAERELKVYYDEQVIGLFRADIVAYNFIIELKSVPTILTSHKSQLINYLKSTNYQNGLLFNFGESSLKFHRIINNYYHP